MSTISTPEFDLLFNQLNSYKFKNERFQRRIERVTHRQNSISDPTSRAGSTLHARYDRIIGKLQSKVESNVELIDEIDSQLPKDEFLFDFDFTQNSFGQDSMGIEWTVVNSPYDDTYVGDDKVSIQTYGFERTNKGSRRNTTRYGLGYCPDDTTKTFYVQNSRIFNQFMMDDFSTSLLSGSFPAYTSLDTVEM